MMPEIPHLENCGSRREKAHFILKSPFSWNLSLMTSLDFQPPNLFSIVRRRIQRRLGGRLQRLAVRKDFPVGKIGGCILTLFLDGGQLWQWHRHLACVFLPALAKLTELTGKMPVPLRFRLTPEHRSTPELRTVLRCTQSRG